MYINLPLHSCTVDKVSALDHSIYYVPNMLRSEFVEEKKLLEGEGSGKRVAIC